MPCSRCERNNRLNIHQQTTNALLSALWTYPQNPLILDTISRFNSLLGVPSSTRGHTAHQNCREASCQQTAPIFIVFAQPTHNRSYPTHYLSPYPSPQLQWRHHIGPELQEACPVLELSSLSVYPTNLSPYPGSYFQLRTASWNRSHVHRQNSSLQLG